MFLTVCETFFRPLCTASSIPLGDELLSSITLAMDMVEHSFDKADPL
jgi:hypothetical protein